MPSDVQIAANRRNALKSTGPRTPQGKAAIRFNNLQHGIHAESETILGEDPDALAALTVSYRDQFQAATQLESDLVDCIIHHAWLLRRHRKTEAQVWAGERRRMGNLLNRDNLTNGEVFANHVGAFSRMQRRIDSTERNFHRAVDSFHLRRSQRLAAQEDGAAEAATEAEAAELAEATTPAIEEIPEPTQEAAPEPQPPQNGFEPSSILAPRPALHPAPAPVPAANPEPPPKVPPTHLGVPKKTPGVTEEDPWRN